MYFFQKEKKNFNINFNHFLNDKNKTETLNKFRIGFILPNDVLSRINCVFFFLNFIFCLTAAFPLQIQRTSFGSQKHYFSLVKIFTPWKCSSQSTLRHVGVAWCQQVIPNPPLIDIVNKSCFHVQRASITTPSSSSSSSGKSDLSFKDWREI